MSTRFGNRPWLTFALASATLATGAACLHLIGGGSVDHQEFATRPSRSPRPASGPARAIQSLQAQLQRRSRERQRISENRAYRTSFSADAGRVASRFIRAYLLYEVGEADARSLSILRMSSTPQLRRRLLNRPVRIRTGATPPRGRLIRIGSVRATAVLGRHGFAIAAVVARQGSPQQVLGVAVVMHRGHLAVAEFGR